MSEQGDSIPSAVYETSQLKTRHPICTLKVQRKNFFQFSLRRRCTFCSNYCCCYILIDEWTFLLIVIISFFFFRNRRQFFGVFLYIFIFIIVQKHIHIVYRNFFLQFILISLFFFAFFSFFHKLKLKIKTTRKNLYLYENMSNFLCVVQQIFMLEP